MNKIKVSSRHGLIVAWDLFGRAHRQVPQDIITEDLHLPDDRVRLRSGLGLGLGLGSGLGLGLGLGSGLELG